ncbi:unnamed protein product [Thelazia callipaeda]|uniref:LITAF domain-containing protein n=1 Tax=Thelazia callipaeda TaxID=103827 RepID=A0A0N5DCK3_THECL|nr:unnamed protein product [Thelazia callipaeda]
MVSTNTQSNQSEMQEECTRSLNSEKATEKKQFQCPVCEREFPYKIRKQTSIEIQQRRIVLCLMRSNFKSELIDK